MVQMNNENETSDAVAADADVHNRHGHDIEGMRMRKAIRERMRERQAMHDRELARRDASEFRSELAKLVARRVWVR
jgi:hypothetical protein